MPLPSKQMNSRKIQPWLKVPLPTSPPLTPTPPVPSHFTLFPSTLWVLASFLPLFLFYSWNKTSSPLLHTSLAITSPWRLLRSQLLSRPLLRSWELCSEAPQYTEQWYKLLFCLRGESCFVHVGHNTGYNTLCSIDQFKARPPNCHMVPLPCAGKAPTSLVHALPESPAQPQKPLPCPHPHF